MQEEKEYTADINKKEAQLQEKEREISELNAKLYEAGLQTLLDDINTQYEAWKSIK